MTTTPTKESSPGSSSRGIWRSIGPALIVACVVVGPGSILTSSKVGCQFGYEMTWLLLLAGLLMVGAVAAAARVGVALDGSPCTELAERLGRPVAILAGLSVFLITACFQFSNNLGVLASLDPLAGASSGWQPWILGLLNAAIIACLFGLKHLYKPVEKLMMILVGVMLVGFAANWILASPSLASFFGGFVPRVPEELKGRFLPKIVQDDVGTAQLIDPWIVVQGLLVTTFSIAGAFYQAYLVREKGWDSSNLRQGVIDAVVGVAVLVLISLMIMSTSAAVLHGAVEPSELSNAADVARQLEPLFGSAAKWLFCLGIFAAALSSFLVNSMIGGAMLADGLGLDSRIDSLWSRAFTTLVLVIGMLIALNTDADSRIPLIIFAQAMTVLGGPILVLALAYLLWRARVEKGLRASHWLTGLLGVSTIVVFALAVRTAWRIYLTLQM
ncbi:Nramp family divalent metal transporter [Pirellulales bacterium]|nr:Nramp family divalent metal transporter [Pirellulales bacterium]